MIHGEPSGLDNTASCFGGAVKLNRSLGRFETLSALPELHILLVNTRVARTTKDLVARVRALKDALPDVVQHIFSSIEAISQEFLKQIEAVCVVCGILIVKSSCHETARYNYSSVC